MGNAFSEYQWLLNFGFAAVVAAYALVRLEKTMQLVAKQVRAVVIAVCVFICVTAGLDFLSQYGLMLHPIVGQVITGLVLSRGANVFHDLVKKVEA